MEVLRLGSLSRTLRDIVHSSPELWSTVTFFVRHDESDIANYLPRWLSNAVNQPLKIRIKAIDYERWSWDENDRVLEIVGLLHPYLGQCTHLDLRLPFPRLGMLPEKPGALPLLQHLSIFLSGSSFGSESFVLDMPVTVAPQLREACLFGLWIEHTHISWDHLESLHLDRIFIEECAQALTSASPNLAHFTVYEVLTDSSRPSGRSSTKSPIIFPKLKTMEWFGRIDRGIADLFERFVAPRLTILRLAPSRGQPQVSSIIPLLKSAIDSASITIITIDMDGIPIALWSAVPHATVIGLPAWDRMGRLERPSLTDDLITLYTTPSSTEWRQVEYVFPAID